MARSLLLAEPIGLLVVQSSERKSTDSFRLGFGQPPCEPRGGNGVVGAGVGLVESNFVVLAEVNEGAFFCPFRMQVAVDADGVHDGARQIESASVVAA
ncbi:hypothetical protein BAY61_18040 [Prauserella marina]|nr:hypothetical protein BAY61_18040 [Prauserella marina]